MKKALLPLLTLVACLFFGAKSTNRFSTADDMVKAVLTALQKNDTLRYLELFPTRDEAMKALVKVPDHSMGEYSGSDYIPTYYANKRLRAIAMFRVARKKVTDEGINWEDVNFVSAQVNHLKGNFYSSDSLYDVIVTLKAGNRNITMRLQEVMLTATGWNCGTILKIKVLPVGEDQASMAMRIKADSTRIVDSIVAVENAQQAERKFRMDSIMMADSMSKPKQQHPKRKPK